MALSLLPKSLRKLKGSCEALAPPPPKKKIKLSAESASTSSDTTEQYLDNYLSSILPANRQDDVANIRYQAVLLNTITRKKKEITDNLDYREKGMSSKKLKLMCEIRGGVINYSDMLTVHTLWKEYVKSVFDFDNLNSQQQMMNLYKMDLHGSMIEVTGSRNKSVVGITGITAKETRNSLQIIRPDDKLTILPKEHLVFKIIIGKWAVTFYGSNLLIRPSERAAKRFKAGHFLPDVIKFENT